MNQQTFVKTINQSALKNELNYLLSVIADYGSGELLNDIEHDLLTSAFRELVLSKYFNSLDEYRRRQILEQFEGLKFVLLTMREWNWRFKGVEIVEKQEGYLFRYEDAQAFAV